MLRKSTMIGVAEAGFDAGKVEGPELVPFGDDDRRVRALQAGVGVVRELDAGKQRLRDSKPSGS